MARKKVTKAAKRRLTLLTPIVILAIGYLVFTLVTTVYQLYSLHNEKTQLKSNLTDLKGESEELKNEINKLQDKDYVARYARETYFYTKDGEYVIKVPKKEQKKEQESFTFNEEYIIYGGAGLSALVLLYIMVKARKRKKKKQKIQTKKKA